MKRQQPKYRDLADWAIEQITTGKVARGEKFYTESALCDMFGISRQTVRQALGLLENEGYLERQRGSGSYVKWAGETASARSNTVGVIITFTDDYIFPAILRGIEQVLSRNGYSVQLVFTHNRVENERRALLNMLEKGVDGVIVEPTKSGLPNPNLELYHKLHAQGTAVVFFNAYYPGTPWPHIVLDDKSAGRKVTEYLITRGHTDIAGFFQSDDLQGHLRYAGYLDALMRNNIPVQADRVMWYATEDIPHLFTGDERRVLDRIEGCTAVVCYNDNVATALLAFLNKKGLAVPEDISVVGVDDAWCAGVCEPPLTTVKHPTEQLGKVAAQNLIEKINDPEFEATVEFEAKLIERGSVKRLAKGKGRATKAG